jgi:hypothetical protein
MSVITINGRCIEASGSGSISIINGVVKVDGVTIENGLHGVVEVKWEGPLANLQTDASVTCGDVRGNVGAGGSVHSADIQGSVNAGGSINCHDIAGSANAGGSIHCNSRSR